LLSIASFVYFFSQGATNYYGDGVAHVNIARKVVDSPDDSLWQRYIQIGTPWLPLQTVSMLPLVWNDWMWRTGVAGSIVSMISFVVAALAIFLLAKSVYRKEDEALSRALPFISAAIFVLNPSALYMQSTPMTESVFMGALAAAVYALQKWSERKTARRLAIAAFAMTLATLARYEAWPVAAASVALVAIAPRDDLKKRIGETALFAAIVAAGPLYWLWHNWAIYGNAFEFLSGPHSARGLFQQNEARLGWSKIFTGHAFVDLLLMLVTTAVCIGPFLTMLGATGLGRFLIAKRKTLAQDAIPLLLVVPFFFHILSLYRGEIQIFPLSAFGLHNARYGLPHLAAIALFAPASALLFAPKARRWAIRAMWLTLALQYGYLISEGPSQIAVYQEGYRNGVNAREPGEKARVAAWLNEHPVKPVIWINTGALGPVVSKGGLRFSDTIHEGSLRWHAIDDHIPDDVSTVIFQEGDPIDVWLGNNRALADDLAQKFQKALSVGKISVFRRK
jgi:dolichyl-phosphate-mannose-protein mannosyltransferase